MNRRFAWPRLVCVVASLSALTVVAAAQTPRYSVKKIGPLPGHNGSFGHSINDAGQVAGWSNTTAAFRWTAGALVALPPLSGGTSTNAERITEDGTVLGSSNATGAADHATVWFPAGNGFDVVDLGVGPGDLFSVAFGMNAGIIAGYSDDALVPKPAVWLPPTQDPGPYTIEMLPFVPGDFGGGATGVDAAGRVFGYTASGFSAHAARWTHTGGAWVVTDLGSLAPNFGAEVNAVDANGLAVGYSVAPVTFIEHAVQWGPGGIVDLGTLHPGWRTNANGVNAAGDVVGKAGPFGYTAAWVRIASVGAMVDLNTRIPVGSPWSLVDAKDINAAGQITGTGHLAGFNQTFLLTPISMFLTGPVPGIAGQVNRVNVTSATPGGIVRVVWGAVGGETAITGCPSINLDIQQATQVGTTIADAAGNAILRFKVRASSSGSTFLFQAHDLASCRVTNVTRVTF